MNLAERQVAVARPSAVLHLRWPAWGFTQARCDTIELTGPHICQVGRGQRLEGKVERSCRGGGIRMSMAVCSAPSGARTTWLLEAAPHQNAVSGQCGTQEMKRKRHGQKGDVRKQGGAVIVRDGELGRARELERGGVVWHGEGETGTGGTREVCVLGRAGQLRGCMHGMAGTRASRGHYTGGRPWYRVVHGATVGRLGWPPTARRSRARRPGSEPCGLA